MPPLPIFPPWLNSSLPQVANANGTEMPPGMVNEIVVNETGSDGVPTSVVRGRGHPPTTRADLQLVVASRAQPAARCSVCAAQKAGGNCTRLWLTGAAREQILGSFSLTMRAVDLGAFVSFPPPPSRSAAALFHRTPHTAASRLSLPG
jgi:hypothetical protein